MKQMGYQPEKESRKNNATKLWKENERSVLAKSVEIWGLRSKPSEKPEELVGRGIQGSTRPDDRRD